MLFVCYDNCSSCRKAKKWLDEHGFQYEQRSISECRPGENELREWQRCSGLPIKRFFNTSGLLYRALELSQRMPQLSDNEAFRLLASDGMLVRRPILRQGDTVLVGFDEDEWEKKLIK